jgi:hypothetical protein
VGGRRILMACAVWPGASDQRTMEDAGAIASLFVDVDSPSDARVSAPDAGAFDIPITLCTDRGSLTADTSPLHRDRYVGAQRNEAAWVRRC